MFQNKQKPFKPHQKQKDSNKTTNQLRKKIKKGNP